MNHIQTITLAKILSRIGYGDHNCILSNFMTDNKSVGIRTTIADRRKIHNKIV